MGTIDRLEEIGGTKLDWRRWPVVIVTPPPRQVADQELLAFMERYGDVVRIQRSAHVLVLDLRDAGQMSPRQRKLMTDMFKVGEGELSLMCRGTAMVMNSALLRGMLTAMLWIWKPPYELKTFADLEPAVDWARRLMESREVRSIRPQEHTK